MLITRRLEIDYGHRLMRHEGKCQNYHGHRGIFEITCEASELDDVGRVIDFGVVKQLVGGWLDEVLDHGMILEKGDPLIEHLRNFETKVLVIDHPPSIENLTKIVFERAQELLKREGMRVVKVRGYETPNCWADCRLSDL